MTEPGGAGEFVFLSAPPPSFGRDMTSTARSLSILLLFRTGRPALSAQEIARETGTTLSTAYRDIATLRDLGMLESYGGERFVLGGGISILDRVARLTDPLRAAVFPEMQQLSAETGLTVTMTRLYGTQLLGVDHVIGDAALSIGYERGEMVPLFRGCSGKVILSVLPWRRLKAIHSSSGVDVAAAGLGKDWQEFLESVRGFARRPVLWTAGEVIPENMAVATPIRNEASGVTASITMILRQSVEAQFDKHLLEAQLIAARDRAQDRLRSMMSQPR